MTNSMILEDPMLGQTPKDDRGWTGVQRQLAADTAPGFDSRVLMADFAVTSNTTLQDTSMALSLLANVRYWYEYEGLYNRDGSSALGISTAFSFTGTTHVSTDNGMLEYFNTSSVETQGSSQDPFSTMSLGTNGTAHRFTLSGWVTCVTPGILTVKFSQRSGADADTATLYAGTRIIFQPIINLNYERNT